jgi:hypothetical protein
MTSMSALSRPAYVNGLVECVRLCVCLCACVYVCVCVCVCVCVQIGGNEGVGKSCIINTRLDNGCVGGYRPHSGCT